jgi:hypothetical protein
MMLLFVRAADSSEISGLLSLPLIELSIICDSFSLRINIAKKIVKIVKITEFFQEKYLWSFLSVASVSGTLNLSIFLRVPLNNHCKISDNGEGLESISRTGLSPFL